MRAKRGGIYTQREQPPRGRPAEEPTAQRIAGFSIAFEHNGVQTGARKLDRRSRPSRAAAQDQRTLHAQSLKGNQRCTSAPCTTRP